jgi:ligand-binding sensor domain-containing protein/signal transduction histidine kinase/DNA-binding response OmpR family regulator
MMCIFAHEGLLKKHAPNMRKSLSILFFLLFFTCKISLAQTPVFEHVLRDTPVFAMVMDKYNVLWIGTENGLVRYDSKNFRHYRFDPRDSMALLDNSVRSLFYDSNQNLWVGTRNGLNRYVSSRDNFRQYIPNNTAFGFLHGSFIKSITEDAQGNIWLGTEGNGLNRLNPSTGKFDYVKAGVSLRSISNNNVEKLTVDSKGGLWVATRHGLNYRDPGTEEWNQYFVAPERASTNPTNDLVSVETDKEGDLWICSRDGKLSHLKKNGQIATIVFPGLISASFTDAEGNILLGTMAGEIFRIPFDNPAFDAIVNITPAGLKTGTIRSLYSDPWQNLWIGSETGLFVVYAMKRQFKAVREIATGTSLTDVMTMITDHKQRLWLSSGRNLWVKDNDSWINPERLFLSGSRFEKDFVYKLFSDSQNIIWIGTFNNGLYRFNPENGRLDHFDLKEPGDTDGSNSVWDIKEDKQGNLWIATWGRGLIHFNTSRNTFIRYTANASSLNSLTSNKLLSLLIDSAGIIWIGTDGGGLNSFDLENLSFEQYNLNKNENVKTLSRSILSLHEDSKGHIWIGSDGGGLFRYDKKSQQFEVFNHEHGLLNGSVKMILQDKQENLWVSTNGAGIFLFDARKERFSQFTQEDGLSTNRFHNGSGLLNDVMYFGGTLGYTYFNPDEIKANNFSPQLLITELSINNQTKNQEQQLFLEQVKNQGEIRFSSSTQLITIEFAAVEYSLSKRNYYRYRLKGLNDQWTSLDQHPRISFMNLPHGSYTLELQSTNSDGLWVENVHALNFIVLPPFYKTPWFLVLIFILLAALLYLWYTYTIRGMRSRQALLESEVEKRTENMRVQAEKLEKQNKILVSQKSELTDRNQKIIDSSERIRVLTKKMHESDMMKLRFFTNVSHEIRTPLTLIIGPLDYLIQQYKAKAEKKEETLEYLITMRQNAERILQLFDEIVTFRKAESGSLELATRQGNISSFLQNLLYSFKDFAIEKNINLQFVSNPNEILMNFDPEKLEKVFTNLLSNALKFTEANGQVLLEVYKSQNNSEGINGDSVQILVKDTGIGIPENDLENIFERFYQVGDKGLMSPSEGVGIGLSLAKSLVEIHKGFITVESTIGMGTTFRVVLPTGELDHENIQAMSEIPNEMFHSGTINHHLLLNKPLHNNRSTDENTIISTKKNKKSILIVEDNAELRNYLVNWLKTDFNVFDAANGAEGLEMALKEIPDLVISDVIMPVMDGFEFLRKLKSNIEISHIPVILLTAKVNIEDRITGMNLSADAYIDKPFHLQHLTATLNSLLENRRYVQRKYREILNLDPTDTQVVSPDEVFLKKAKEVIEINISNPDFNVNQLSQEVGVSRAGVYRKLKALTNLSVNIMIRNMRIKRAAQILSQNKLYVNEVAFMVGFNDVQYFRKCFRQMYHMTPSEYAAKNASDEFPDLSES